MVYCCTLENSQRRKELAVCDKMEGLTEADIAEINGRFDGIKAEIGGVILAEHEEDGVRMIDDFELQEISLGRITTRFMQEQGENEAEDI